MNTMTQLLFIIAFVEAMVILFWWLRVQEYKIEIDYYRDVARSYEAKLNMCTRLTRETHEAIKKEWRDED